MDYSGWTDDALKAHMAGCKQNMEAAQAELSRREAVAKRKPLYMPLSGPDSDGDYGYDDSCPALPFFVNADRCERLNLDPAEVARAAALCLCMADWVGRANRTTLRKIEFGSPLSNQFCWLFTELLGGKPAQYWTNAARAAGWIS